MVSRSIQIIGGADREHAHVDAALNALQVKIVGGGGSGGGTEFAEDSAHTSGDLGTQVLAVRNDAGTSLVSADGDYASLQVDSTGALRVTGGGGGTQFAEDSAHTSGDLGTQMLAVRNDAGTSLVSTDGDYGSLQLDSTGALRVTGGGGGTQFAEDAAHTTGDLGTQLLAVRNDANTSLVSTDGDYASLQVNSNGALFVDAGTGACFPVENCPATTLSVDDAGGSLTVDGTVAVSSVSGTVAATQSGSWTVAVTQPVSVDDNGGSLTVDGTVAATQSGAWSVSVSNFPATQPVSGTVAIGSTVVPGTGATNLGKAEDAIHATGDVGVMALAVRRDADTAAAADGDYHHLTIDDAGRLKVDASGTVTVNEPVSVDDNGGSLTVDGTVAATQSGAWTVAATQSGSWTVAVTQPVSIDDNGGSITVDGTVAVGSSVTPGTGATNLGKAEDAAHVTGDVGVMALAVRQDTAGPMAADGDYHALTVNNESKLNTAAHLYVSGAIVEGANPVPISIESNLSPGTGANNLGKAEDAAHSSGDVGVMALAVRNDAGTALAGTDGDYIPLMTDDTGSLRVRVQQTALHEVRLRDGGGADNVTVKQDSDGLGAGAAAVLAGGKVQTPTASGVLSNDDMGVLRTDKAGNLQISGFVRGGQTTANVCDVVQDGVLPDETTYGIPPMAEVVSSVTLSTSTWDHLTQTTSGRLRVDTEGESVSTIALSGSTRGRPIQITGTATGTANTIHTATTTSGELDRVFIDLTNTSVNEVVVTIEFGTTGTANETKVTVPAESTVPAVEGMVLGGAATDTIKAYAATGSVVNALGRVERLS